MTNGSILIRLQKSGSSLVVGGGLNPSPHHVTATESRVGITVKKTITDKLLNKLYNNELTLTYLLYISHYSKYSNILTL